MESGGKRDKRRASKIDGQEQLEAQALWGMLYADEDIVSRSPGERQRAMTAIATACAAFEITSFGGQNRNNVPADERC